MNGDVVLAMPSMSLTASWGQDALDTSSIEMGVSLSRSIFEVSPVNSIFEP